MTFKNGLFLTLAAIALTGCNTNPLGSKNFVTNRESVADLNSLMAAHPEFQTASLMDIKMAAQGTPKNDAASLDVKFSTDGEKPTTGEAKPAQLDQTIAGKAQGLIDKILDDFNLEAQMNSDIMILGIVMNMQRDVLDRMKKEEQAKNTPANDVAGMAPPPAAAPAPVTTMPQIAYPTCEELVEKPFGDMPKDQMIAMLNSNHEQLKSTISGCAKIQGQPFVKCMENFNKMAAIVNEHANCDMKNLDELTKIAEKEFGKSFAQIQHESTECLGKHFFQCGYKMVKANKKNK